MLTWGLIFYSYSYLSMYRFSLFLLLFLSACSLHVRAAEMPDSVTRQLQQAQNRLTHFHTAHESDSVICCQEQMIAIYKAYIAGKQADDDRRLGATNGVVAIEFFFLIILIMIIAVYAASIVVRKKLKSHYDFELHKFELNTYTEVVKSQKELLNATSVAAPSEVGKQVEQQLNRAIEAIDKLRREISPEQLSEILVSQAQGLSTVRRMLDASENDTKPGAEEWTALRDDLERVNPVPVAYLDSQRSKMITDDYRMCLLVLAGIPPKHMVRLLCCTPQKISMQRKRYLQAFFGRSGRPAEFDLLLRTYKG